MKRLLRARLLHYLALGALLMAARDGVDRAWQPVASVFAGRPEIVVSGDERVRIRRRLGMPETGPAEVTGRERPLVDEAIDDEILYRAALELGLDRDNAVVRERVVQDMRVLTGDHSTGDEEMLREGLHLGLDRSDLVVRRHLAATMRLLAAAPARTHEAGDAELRDVLERYAEEFRVPAATTLRHVFFSKRGGREAAQERASRALAGLRGNTDGIRQAALRGEPSETDVRNVASSGRPVVNLPEAPYPADAAAGDFRDVARLGDAFALGSVLRERTDAEIDSTFGAGFAAALAASAEHSWTGPIESRYGLHLVWIDSRRKAEVPPLDVVRGRVLERFYSDRRRQQVQRWLARERERYTIRVEAPASLEHGIEQTSLPIEMLSLPRPAAVVGD
jgi:peptidyl-prolyl cis-trans isomerase C